MFTNRRKTSSQAEQYDCSLLRIDATVCRLERARVNRENRLPTFASRHPPSAIRYPRMRSTLRPIV